MSRSIAGLSALAGDYDVLLSDVWGVIHNGRESFPAACEALARWRETRGPVILISNSPRPAREVIAQLADLGVQRRHRVLGAPDQRVVDEQAAGRALAGLDAGDQVVEGRHRVARVIERNTR